MNESTETEFEKSVDCSGAETSRIGHLIEGHIEVLALLGHGASGSVFRGRDTRLEREVAVKIMHPHLLGNQENLRRFQRERIFSGALVHPGIVRTYSSGITFDGAPYLVMDLLQGRTLSAVVAEETIEGERFFSLFLQVIEALEYLHSQNVVHRDLKPSNIVLTGSALDERAVLIDFGLARYLAGETEQGVTKTGAVMGTSFYMSPEQCTGASVDRRTDIYSLACVMYEVLSGKPPFIGESSYEVMFKQLNSSLSKLGELKRLPKSLAAFLTRCLQKDPAARFQSMAALKEAFLKCRDACDGESRTKAGGRGAGPRIAMIIVATLAVLTVLAVMILRNAGARFFPSARSEVSATLPRGFGALRSQIESLGGPQRDRKAYELVMLWLRQRGDEQKSDVYTFAAQAALNVGDYSSAEKYASKVLRNRSDSLYAACARIRGQTLSRLGQHRKARQQFLDGLKLLDVLDCTEARYLLLELSLLSMAQDQPEQALSELLQLKERLRNAGVWDEPQSVECRIALCRAYFRLGKLEQARSEIRQFMALEDKQADPFVAHAELSALAEVCRRCGELKLNGELLDAAVRVAPNTLARDQLLRAKYCALYEHGRRSEAIAGLESLLKDEARAAAAPTNIAATKLALCGYLQMAGEAPAALKLAQEVLYDERLRGDYLRAASLRTVADLIAFTRGPEQQLLFAESANRIDPSANFHRNWLRLMGDCCLQRGRLSEALDYYERTLAAFPDVDDITTLSGRGEVCLVAGDILMSLGKYEAAVKYFRKGAELCSVRRDDRETLIPLYLRLVSVEKCLKIPDLSSKYAVVMNYATEDLDPRSRCLWLERFSTLYDDKVKRRSMLEKAIEATRSFPDQEVAKFRRLKLERLLIGCDEKVNLSKVMGLINQWEPLSHVERNSEMAALCIVAAESVPTQDKELWSKWAYRAASFSAETPAETVMVVTQALAVQAYLRGYKHLGDQFRQKCAAVPIPAGAESLVLIRMESQRVFAKALAVSDPAESERLWALAIRTAEERRDQFSAARTWHMRAESTLERDPSKAVEYYLKSSHIYAEQKSPSLVLATMQEALVVIRPKNKPDLLAKLQNELAALRK